MWTILDDTGSFFVNIKEHVEKGQRNLYVMKMVIAMVENMAGDMLMSSYGQSRDYPADGETDSRMTLSRYFGLRKVMNWQW